MGGEAMHIDLPTIQFKTSSSNVPPLPPSSNLNLPVSATYTGSLRTSCSAPSCSCHGGNSGRLQTVDGREEKGAIGSVCNHVFAHVPSQSEVENAVDALRNFMLGNSSSGSQLKWLQKKLDCFDARLLLSHGYRRVANAFRLLQIDPSVKGLVVSIASDKSVWDAIMKNEEVQKLRESHYTVNYERPRGVNEEPDLATTLQRWILDVTKAIVMELIEKLVSLVDELFQLPGRIQPTRGNNEQMEEKVRSSFLLSVVILLIVIVARAQNA
ncbi:uncharacterized protein LOC121241583 [Juglans microcarpa x Juglans regia]|uniref:uncharacterized protein LOC121241583 n=1 Tax=Juglans microcarpa x Juglans regia TaxID=2249226 RepID=UPI001B7E9A42|nr:uncharacterized protein LOC121241583 [Juglans microcarpa x Juglans regia]